MLDVKNATQLRLLHEMWQYSEALCIFTSTASSISQLWKGEVQSGICVCLLVTPDGDLIMLLPFGLQGLL